MSDLYFSLKSESLGSYKEKGSKFLSHAIPVNSEQDAMEQIEVLKKKYHDARHHCYAYMIGPTKDEYRSNDDGEPNHSAGDPILGQIRSFNLTNILIVVVRYFGGTKLGVGGLIHAYKTAAAEAIENGVIVKHHVMECLTVYFTYEQMSIVMRLAKEYNADIIDQQFEEACVMKIEVRQSKFKVIFEQLESIFGVTLKKN